MMHSVSPTSGQFPSFQQWSPMGILAGGIFIIDLLIPLGVATGVLYIVVILLSLRHQDSRLPLWTAACCSILTIMALFISPIGGEFWKVLANRGLALFAIWTTTLMGRVQLQQTNTNQLNLLVSDRVFMASNDHISILGQDYRYRRINPSYEKIHGKDSQEVVGMSVSELLGDEVFNQTVKPMLDKCFQGHEVHYEAWFKFADNQDHFMSVSYLPLGSANTDNQELVVIARDMTDRKKSEDALYISEQRHRSLIQSAPFCIHEIDLRGRIVSMNATGLSMIGMKTESEIIGRSYLELVEEEDHERIREFFTQTCNGQTVDFEFHVTENNVTQYYWKSFTPVRDARNHIMMVMGIAEDITERTLAQENVAQKEQQLRTILDAMTNFVGIGTADGTITDCNQAPLTLAGLTREDVIGKRFIDTDWLNYSPKIQEQVRDIIQRVSQGEIVREDYQARMGENLILTIDACFVPVKDTAGKVQQIVHSGIDVTDRRQAEDALRESELRFRTYFETGLVGMGMMSLEKEWLEVNDRLCAILGYSREELQGKTWTELTYPDDLPHDETEFNKILAGTQNSYSTFKRFFRKDGSLLHANMYAHAVRKSSGEIDYFTTMVEDITEQKLGEALLMKWAMIFQHTQWGVAVSSGTSTTLEMVNEAYAHMHGYAIREMEGMTVAQVFTPEFRARLPKIIEQIHHEGFLSFEAQHIRKDGSTFPSLVTVSAIKDLNGQVLYRVANVIDISNLKHAEEALRNSEQRYRNYFESGLVGMTITSVERCWIEVNDRLCDILGYSRDELQRKTWAELTYPDDLLSDETKFNTLLAGTLNSYSMEKRFIKKDGTLIFANIYVQAVRKSSGEIDYFTAMIEDITDRKQTEQQLQDSQAWIAGIVDIADDAVIAIDETQCITLFNQGAENTFGYTADEMLGQPLTRLLPERFTEHHLTHIHIFADSSKTAGRMRERGEVVGRRKHGEEFPAEASISHLRSSKGSTFTVILRDITEHKRAQQASAQLAAIVVSSEDAIMGKDLDGTINYWNQSAERLFGYTVEEALGQNKSMLLPPDRQTEEADHLARVQEGEIIQHFETVRRHKDGTLINVALSISPIRNTEEVLIGASTIARDITEAKKLEQTILRHNEELELIVKQRTERIIELEQRRMQVEKLAALAQIAAGVAHEINNPLASISQSLVLLKRALSKDHPHFHYLAKTEDCIHRIAAITKKLYQLYRPSGPTPMPVDLRMCIQIATEIMEERALKHGMRIKIPPLPKPIMSQVSQGELIQVLCNLIHNAIDASAEEDTIEMSLASGPKTVSICVADQGEGIPPEATPHIFEPFYTTKQHRTEGGMGLGLSISHSLVESMGGSLDFSTSIGQGTTFTITLPLT